MNTLAKPAMRPARPEFSSGPCAKRPGWNPQNLQNAVLGRSHRSKLGKARLKEAIDRTRQVLQVPDDYLIGIVAGSDTGAVEMALWSMLGPKTVQLLAFESFGKDWVTDVVKQLKLPAEVLDAPYGELPDLTKVRKDADLVFTWNGTTSGVRVPNADFIAADREGITICDATSAAFAQDLDWAKLDVVTFSWQKALGGEGAHGVLILGPRAVARLESYTPAWPMPKLFRMTKGGKVSLDIFEGATINTPSMLCVEDAIDALKWGEGIGGLTEMQRRADANLGALAEWVAKTPWVEFLAADPATRSNTSVCLKVVDPAVTALSDDAQADFAKKLAAILEKEGVALDIGGYRDAPAGLRIWCGATVETSDLEALTPWLDWAFASIAADLQAA
ncbi:MAG: phosphoserine transaminase [Phenylobacterium sp.]|jgi:phosphoserine aminotransferase|uniref:phosphoserine transaminase n=1 Tax=Phenylobacterium sp. TaxID=1871053 RepID=UPI001B515664|nr:phosphoserine transaminase [Phenylobacterium sp.]MBP7649554.1 phosphoserine transaminase [Phenylobacterium sp.]MBP7816325.1 phosphoserine transaminase [Phenylobacterium sp.]MBP9229916.1 phosphoserine transaminase [Phenylobacterium sp.]MBP9754057.1 phosphoserine transaminase [Phenylobacterium sp.]